VATGEKSRDQGLSNKIGPRVKQKNNGAPTIGRNEERNGVFTVLKGEKPSGKKSSELQMGSSIENQRGEKGKSTKKNFFLQKKKVTSLRVKPTGAPKEKILLSKKKQWGVPTKAEKEKKRSKTKKLGQKEMGGGDGRGERGSPSHSLGKENVAKSLHKKNTGGSNGYTRVEGTWEGQGKGERDRARVTASWGQHKRKR